MHSRGAPLPRAAVCPSRAPALPPCAPTALLAIRSIGCGESFGAVILAVNHQPAGRLVRVGLLTAAAQSPTGCRRSTPGRKEVSRELVRHRAGPRLRLRLGDV